MSSTKSASNTIAPTQFLQTKDGRFAYRRFGAGSSLPLLCLQHFMETLDNWDPAVTDPLAAGRELILFEGAGIGRSSGTVPETIAAMAGHGMVAQEMALMRLSIFRWIILVGTAPRGGEDIMHLEKPILAKYLGDPTLQGYMVLQKIFFAPTETSQAAGTKQSALAELAAIREWGIVPPSDRFAMLNKIQHPTLIAHGNKDVVVMPINAFRLAKHLPNAQLIMYPDSSHGAQSQHAEVFLQHVKLFLQ